MHCPISPNKYPIAKNLLSQRGKTFLQKEIGDCHWPFEDETHLLRYFWIYIKLLSLELKFKVALVRVAHPFQLLCFICFHSLDPFRHFRRVALDYYSLVYVYHKIVVLFSGAKLRLLFENAKLFWRKNKMPRRKAFCFFWNLVTGDSDSPKFRNSPLSEKKVKEKVYIYIYKYKNITLTILYFSLRPPRRRVRRREGCGKSDCHCHRHQSFKGKKVKR